MQIPNIMETSFQKSYVSERKQKNYRTSRSILICRNQISDSATKCLSCSQGTGEILWKLWILHDRQNATIFNLEEYMMLHLNS